MVDLPQPLCPTIATVCPGGTFGTKDRQGKRLVPRVL